ncbi:AzlC family ABC transporter permease [Devosia sp.]|uniref:AzlC family ABC transporter permease n=1 Tax=Devosia sp. TaxID=1871048 RepID=UPI001AD4A31D|nr:AzlC family ABC transporter permease [Devosia sp.]MBN9309844.1 AzlC family ABC transporter permease [Devosia sp.]
MHAPAPHHGRDQFWLGIRMFTPVAISIAAYGLVWGVLAGQAGLSVAEVALMSGLVFAGSSQFVVLDMWTPGSLPIASIVIATAIVNLRILLMSATLRPLLAPLPRWRALGATFFVTDETWAMTMTEIRKGGAGVAFFLGTGVLSWLAWMLSTLTGRVLGAFIDDPARYGLDFAFTATFLALLLGMWKGRGDLVPWIVAALAAIATSRLVDGNWYIIVGGLAGSLAGAVAESLKERRHVA